MEELHAAGAARAQDQQRHRGAVTTLLGRLKVHDRRACRIAATLSEGWDRDVRAPCRRARHRLSRLLTPDREPEGDVGAAFRAIASRLGLTPAYSSSGFALDVGMLLPRAPRSEAHMREDSRGGSRSQTLSADDRRAIEG